MPDNNNTEAGRPRLAKLIVRNFRAIGQKAVEIELDDIVILVGPNNAGKSSILSAYETIMSDGSKEANLSIDDFPKCEVHKDSLPEIELHTIVTDDSPGKEWCESRGDGSHLVREKWVWPFPGPPKRVGFNVELGRWAEEGDTEQVPWGAAGVANARRPQAHRVNAFDPPDQQTDELIRLLDALLEERLHARLGDARGESDLNELVGKVKQIQLSIVEETRSSIQELESSLSNLIGKVFPRHRVVFDPRPLDADEKVFKFFAAGSELRMGPEGGYLSGIARQGSGARRTLLWTALKLLADQGVRARPAGSKAKTAIKVDAQRPHLLLMDEPEICLHPSAIRESCNLLYGLPRAGNWQVMITTHSPCFIDFSRDNTTIVRVELRDDGEVTGTTIFRPDKTELDNDDRRRLKLLNLSDPYVAEFFFGGRSVIVEGDTEHTAFAQVRRAQPERFSDVHVIRARGKATIVSLMKILNHFGAPYGVLHDSDLPKCKRRDGKEITNPAWTMNSHIIQEAAKAQSDVRVAAAVPNFDSAFLGGEIQDEKPYGALVALQDDTERLKNVTALLAFLVGEQADPPLGARRTADSAAFEELAADFQTAGAAVPAGGA